MYEKAKYTYKYQNTSGNAFFMILEKMGIY